MDDNGWEAFFKQYVERKKHEKEQLRQEIVRLRSAMGDPTPLLEENTRLRQDRSELLAQNRSLEWELREKRGALEKAIRYLENFESRVRYLAEQMPQVDSVEYESLFSIANEMERIRMEVGCALITEDEEGSDS